ncbi:MAG: serine protein kinase RIO [Nanoarchaeota archaeon]|nr:serine protein kinase RIO [Nanoarchaeota archaeon]MBU1321972.1 serine protein kinase RIO [Nanoarchaeota archaeon]MBU1598304.1 serine protein kinase RIO [Nanoarchaeota archaeon]MBU2441798.1 serine protein kinase RIO [Nanoarchaeota archaeon]
MPRESREEWKTYKNVFDNFTLLNLHKLSSQDHFEELRSPVALGKEANIFTAVKGKTHLIVKIYRLENCNFNKMYEYIAPDPRFAGMKKRKRLVILAWVQREYRNLLKAREVIRVPTPIAVKDNILLMELIGRDGPAPPLKDAVPKNLKKFFEKTISNIKALYDAGMVHADLSEFNILNFEEEPVFIDFSQSTTTQHPEADVFLKRDIHNIVKFFHKKGLKTDEKEVYERVVK